MYLYIYIIYMYCIIDVALEFIHSFKKCAYIAHELSTTELPNLQIGNFIRLIQLLCFVLLMRNLKRWKHRWISSIINVLMPKTLWFSLSPSLQVLNNLQLVSNMIDVMCLNSMLNSFKQSFLFVRVYIYTLVYINYTFSSNQFD